MQHELVFSNNIHRQSVLYFSQDEIATMVAQRIANMQPDTKKAGFRAGKVPVDELEKMYGAQAAEESLSQAITDFCLGLMEKEKLPLAGPPIFSPNLQSNAAGISVTVDMLLMPDLPALDYSKYKVYRYILHDDFQKAAIIRATLVEEASAVTYRKSKPDDVIGRWSRVVGEFLIKINDIIVPELSGSKELVIEGGFIEPAIEQQLCGLKKGDRKNFSVFIDPHNVFMPEYAGYELVIDVMITSVSNPIRTQLEPGDWRKMGYTNAEDMYTKLCKNLMVGFAQTTHQLVIQQLQQQLIAQCPVEIPEIFLSLQANKMALENIKKQKTELTEDEKQQIYRDAVTCVRNEVTYGMIMSDYARKQNIVITQERYDAAAEEYLPPDKRHDKELTRDLSARLWIGAAEHTLLSNIEVEDVVVNMAQFMAALVNTMPVTP